MFASTVSGTGYIAVCAVFGSGNIADVVYYIIVNRRCFAIVSLFPPHSVDESATQDEPELYIQNWFGVRNGRKLSENRNVQRLL